MNCTSLTPKTNHVFANILVVLIASITLFGCTLRPGVAPTSTPAQTVAPTGTTAIPAKIPTPTTSPIPFPALTLRSGDFYFSLDGKPGFFFSRNIAGYQPTDYSTFLDWSQAGGSRVARIQLDSMGLGYTSTGGVDYNWVTRWDAVFDKAQADGIYILPVFSGWFDWNDGTGYSTWKTNPLNQAIGGPVSAPGELFVKGSATQTMWLAWMQTLVKHWQGRNNILAWEIFSEVNLASGSTETSGIDFVNNAAAVIRANDPSGRPVSASLADTGLWPHFYRDTNIDYINIHPYPVSAQLDRTIIKDIRNLLSTYNRPVLIGESGLNFNTPDSAAGKITIAQNAPVGTEHAIWAAMVSGAMNGRSLYWEDSFGIYFTGLGIPWMQKYKTQELPAANFVKGIDFSSFRPLISTSTSGVWGAVLGNEHSLLGWFRDATAEPPDWKLLPVIAKQTVTITIRGSAANWHVDFYETKDGTTILGSVMVPRKGSAITIPLPDFHDDIAFKATPQ